MPDNYLSLTHKLASAELAPEQLQALRHMSPIADRFDALGQLHCQY